MINGNGYEQSTKRANTFIKSLLFLIHCTIIIRAADSKNTLPIECIFTNPRFISLSYRDPLFLSISWVAYICDQL